MLILHVSEAKTNFVCWQDIHWFSKYHHKHWCVCFLSCPLCHRMLLSFSCSSWIVRESGAWNTMGL